MSEKYVTTNVRLPKEMHRELKRKALEDDKSLAQVIRESVALYLVGAEAVQASHDAWKDDPLWAIGADAVYADVTDGSTNHDLYLYGPLSEAARAEIRE